MQKLNATLAFLATAGALAFGCSSDTGDDAGGLTGGVTGKGGSTNTPRGGSSGNSTSSGGTGNGTGGTGVIIGTGNTSGTASAGTSGSGTGGDSTGASCTGTTASGQKGKGAVVFFLVDTSGSMNDHPTMTGGTMFGGRGGGMPAGASKLQSTQTALDQAFGTLSSALEVGLAFFPNVPVPAPMSNDPCYKAQTAVPIAPLDAQQKTALTSAVDAAVADGGTPTFDAYTYALQQLQASTATGDKYIVLITDGIPTYGEGCMGNGQPTQTPPIPMQPLIDASQNALTNDGIKTFVVGSPGSESGRATLSAMARVGGTGPAGCADTGPTYCHFDMTTSMDFGASLSTALGEIQQQIPVDCSFELPRPPAGMSLNLDMINVTVTNDDGTKTPVGRDPNGDCATDGWIYVGNPPTGVQLCGTLCNSVKAQAMPSIDVQFGCNQRVNPPR